MDNEQFEREKLYQATMNMFRAMVERGIISEEQYNVTDANMLQKYRPLLGSAGVILWAFYFFAQNGNRHPGKNSLSHQPKKYRQLRQNGLLTSIGK